MTTKRLRRLVLRTAAATALCIGTGSVLEATATTGHAARAALFPSGPATDPVVRFANEALFAMSVDDPAEYRAALAAVAAEVGTRLDVPPSRFVETWSSADPKEMRVVLSALAQLGVSYRYASSSPGQAFDCSGLVKWAWSQSNVHLPSNSSAIIRAVPGTSPDQLEPGDVVWYPGHIMLSLGVDDTIVHAVQRGTPVQVDHISARKLSRIRVGDPLG